MRLNRSLLLVALASVASLIATILLIELSASWAQPTPIAGDPSLYAEIAEDVLSGGVPYIDVTVEHLPAMLLPILAVGLVSDVSGAGYAAMWPLVTIATLLGTVALAARVQFVDDYQRRFAVAVLPMIPLVMYRLEVFVVLLAVAAIVAFGMDRLRAGTGWTVAGTLAKGWPVVLFAVPIRRGAVRIGAIGLGVSILALAVVAALPGFREGRAFTGIHTETIVGNAVLVVRHLTASDLGLVGAAGATYVEAPGIAVILNATIGVAIGIVALVAVFRTTDLARILRVCGLATLAIMLVSPLFSAQFVFWLTPFVPLLAVRSRRLAFVVGALSMLLVAVWNPTAAWWATLVALRNVALVGLAVRWAGEVLAPTEPVAADLPAEHVA